MSIPSRVADVNQGNHADTQVISSHAEREWFPLACDFLKSRPCCVTHTLRIGPRRCDQKQGHLCTWQSRPNHDGHDGKEGYERYGDRVTPFCYILSGVWVASEWYCDVHFEIQVDFLQNRALP